MNLQEQERFFRWMTRAKANSRAASVPKDDKIITEVVNGLIVSRPANKIEHIAEKNESEPIVIDLQKSKAGSVLGINKLRVIHEFIRSNGRI